MISWHETKRRANLKKHGIDLAEVETAFDAPMTRGKTTVKVTVNFGCRALPTGEAVSSSWFGPSAPKALT